MVFAVAFYNETDGEYVIDAFKGHLLLAHLLPYGKGRFCAYLELVLDSFTVQFGLERLNEFCHELLTVLLPGLELIGNEPVLLRFCVIEIDILHLTLHVVKPQLVGKRDIQHEGFQYLTFTGSLGEHLQAAHNLKAVGQLEHSYARILGILDNELLVVLCLQTRVLGLDGGNLVKAVHQGEDAVFPLLGVQHHAAHAGCLMKINRGHTILRKADFLRHNLCHSIRMADER